MKNTLLLSFAMVLSCMVFAQKGEIIYTDFEPDSTAHFHDLWDVQPPNLYLDIDHDGFDDWYFERIVGQYGTFAVRFRYNIPQFTLSYCMKYNPSPGANMAELNWGSGDLSVTYNYAPEIYGGWPPYNVMHFPPHFMALRCKIGEDFYYGWIELSVDFREDGRESDVTIFRMAWCTIPNYPLCVGQTDFTTWGVEENEATAFASVYPNPAKSAFTVTGRNLKAAEVVNTLGQRVATVQGQGEALQIDIATLPTGIYFVNITDKEGRKCVKKVVKE